MQGYSYSTFSLIAIALHLIINFNLITGRWGITTHGGRYRGVLLGILAYFAADGLWGLFAGLGWTRALDEHRFRQILFNLVGNAVKFTSHGSVTVSAVRDGTTLEVAVADTGCGIPREMQGSILDAFVQVQAPTHSADRAGGTGLGLSICRRLVEMMGGELLVESEPGKGSTFPAPAPGGRQCFALSPDGAAMLQSAHRKRQPRTPHRLDPSIAT